MQHFTSRKTTQSVLAYKWGNKWCTLLDLIAQGTSTFNQGEKNFSDRPTSPGILNEDMLINLSFIFNNVRSWNSCVQFWVYIYHFFVLILSTIIYLFSDIQVSTGVSKYKLNHLWESTRKCKYWIAIVTWLMNLISFNFIKI